MPRILSTGTVLPAHRISQADAKARARVAFAGLPDIERLIGLFDRSGVETRYAPFPPDWYMTPRNFRERNDAYVEEGLKLAEAAARRALDRSRTRPEEVDTLVFVTTTGLATPSLDSFLLRRLGMRADVRRMPLFGLGCAGGAGALAVAARVTGGGGTALVVSLELCSLTLIRNEITKLNLLGTALFGDGAAAAVVKGENEHAGAEILAAKSDLFPDSTRLMGWEFTDRGFELLLDPAVPSFIAETLPSSAARFLEENGTRPEEIRHLVFHPGGPLILAAYREGLKLNPGDLRASEETLRRVGNLSSASVLFVLDEVERTGDVRPGDLGLLAAMGPGFAAEMLLLRW